MPKFISFLIIAGMLIFTDCNKTTKTVYLSPNISVELPDNFRKQISNSNGSSASDSDQIIQSKTYTYTATINHDEIFIGNTTSTAYNTLSLDQKKEKIGPNLNGFVRGFEGTNLARKDTIINGLPQSDYSFEKKQMDTLFIVHGRLIIQDSNVWFFNYMSKIPVTNNALKSRDRFFKSIQIK